MDERAAKLAKLGLTSLAKKVRGESIDEPKKINTVKPTVSYTYSNSGEIFYYYGGTTWSRFDIKFSN